MAFADEIKDIEERFNEGGVLALSKMDVAALISKLHYADRLLLSFASDAEEMKSQLEQPKLAGDTIEKVRQLVAGRGSIAIINSGILSQIGATIEDFDIKKKALANRDRDK